MKLTLWQRIQLRLSGHVYLGHRTRPGWTAQPPFYAFKCPTHGLVEDYPHGYENRLECPKCGKTIAYTEPSKTDVLIRSTTPPLFE